MKCPVCNVYDVDPGSKEGWCTKCTGVLSHRTITPTHPHLLSLIKHSTAYLLECDQAVLFAQQQAEAPFRVAYLCGLAVSFAVQMGMHTKADKVLKEAEALIDGCDTDIVEQVAKLRAIIDEARKANYHPSQKKRGRLQ